MRTYTMALLFLSFNTTAEAAPVKSNKGKVCFGPILSGPPYIEPHTLIINDTKKFDYSGSQEFLSYEFDLNKVYNLKIASEGQVLKTFSVDFRRHKRPEAQIWRSKGGSWHLQFSIDYCNQNQR